MDGVRNRDRPTVIEGLRRREERARALGIVDPGPATAVGVEAPTAVLAAPAHLPGRRA